MTPWDPNETGRYWVIGGRYVDPEFRHRNWSEVIGPFETWRDAAACWRKISFLYTHDARVRFTIVRDVEVAEAA